MRAACGLEIRDTADWKSALQASALALRIAEPWIGGSDLIASRSRSKWIHELALRRGRQAERQLECLDKCNL